MLKNFFDQISTLQLLISSFIRDRKSTRLNSSHSQISYAVFCLKKKKINEDVTANGRLHLYAVHFMLPLPTVRVELNFVSRVRTRVKLNSFHTRWPNSST